MKRTIALIILIISSSLVLQSCKKDFLRSFSQDGTLTDDDTFKDKASFEKVIFGTYREMQGSGGPQTGGIAWIQIPALISQDVVPGADEIPVQINQYLTPGSGDITSYWGTFYKIAGRANLILGKLADAPSAVSETDRAVIEGEAKFLRGFAYFNIARAYGNCPLILESYEESQKKIECSSEDQVWDQVILDLTNASQKLPTRTDWGAENLGRATKGTALAYLANAYLYKADWSNAVTVSEKLMALGEYKLLDNVRDVFSLAHKNNEESIFEIQYRDINNTEFDWGGVMPNSGNYLEQWTSPRGIGDDYAPGGGWAGIIMNRKLADSFDPDDDRRRNLVVAVGETYFGEKMASPVTIPASVVSRNSAFTTKYWHGPSPYWGNGTNIPLMRYAEFLLNYAEALFKSGKPEQAYGELNKVRLRAKITAKPVSADEEVFMSDVMQERRWELNFEPNIWFHYMRTQQAAKFLMDEYGVTFRDAWYKWPVPQSERDLNPALCQNNGY